MLKTKKPMRHTLKIWTLNGCFVESRIIHTLVIPSKRYAETFIDLFYTQIFLFIRFQ